MEVLVVPADPSEPEGDEVVRKTASLPGERERILREAQVLRTAADRGVAGVPRLVAAPSAESAVPSLVTGAVAGPSLAVAAPLPVLEVAGVAAEVARLLANLHEAGLVHGAVEPSHVVLDGAGGALLVGLGDGGLAGTASSDPGAGDLDPAADVAAWGMLVGHLLDWSATTDEPLGELRTSLATRRVRRSGRRPSAPRGDGDERRVLAALADQAQDPDPARRPSARSLAVAVAHRIPAAHVPGGAAVSQPPATSGTLLERLAAHVLPGSAGPSPDPAVAEVAPPPPKVGGERRVPPAARRRPPGGRKPHRTPARVLVPSARGGLGTPRAAAQAAPADPLAAAPEEAAPHEHPLRLQVAAMLPTRRRAIAAIAAAIALALLGVAAVGQLRDGSPDRHPGTAAPARACATVEPPAADVDGDGCDEPLQWTAGVLQAGSARFALGGAGDAWAVGDWSCDGRRTPALLHDGALAVFDAWPGPGGELQGRQVATSAGAAGLTVVVGPDGCDRPALRRPGTTDLPVDARRPP